MTYFLHAPNHRPILTIVSSLDFHAFRRIEIKHDVAWLLIPERMVHVEQLVDGEIPLQCPYFVHKSFNLARGLDHFLFYFFTYPYYTLILYKPKLKQEKGKRASVTASFV